MFEIIDTEDSNKVVGSLPTFRKAFNAARKLEPEQSLVRFFNPNPSRRHEGSYRDWRYLIRKAS